MRIWWVAMLGLSGCLWAEVVPGKKMTLLPDGLQWCGPQPASDEPSAAARTDPFPRDQHKEPFILHFFWQ